MTDELTGAKLDNIQEAYDLRRMWVTLALNEFPGQGDRVGAAQGRAIGAVTKGGGAVKEYYSPSRGFYGKEATTVPNAMDAWLFEAQTEELPAPPKGQRVSYSTDFITGGPIFEPEDAPITMGSLAAKFVAPTPKTKVIRPEGPGIEQPTTAVPPKEVAGDTINLTPELEQKLKEDGVFEKFMEKAKASGKTIQRTAGGIFTGTIVGNLLYNLAENPKETLGEIARDESIEGAFRLLTRAATLPAAVASMVTEPMAEQAGPEEDMIDPTLQPPSEKNELTQYLEGIGRSRMATPEESMVQPNVTYTEPDGKFTDPKLELMRRQSVIQKGVDDMSSIATEDAGFVQKNREPEAAPSLQQGFVTQ